LAEFKNPNQQGGGQDSRSLMVFTFVFAVILLGMQIFRPKKPVSPVPNNQTNSASQQANAAGMAASAPAPAAANHPLNGNSPSVPTMAAQSQSTTVVENELYKITFSNRGGQATSWILKRYTSFDGKPLDLINPKAAAKFGNPLSIYTPDANLRKQLAEALYVPSATGSLNVPGDLIFKYSAGGLVVRKIFHFDNSYVIHAEISVTQNGMPVQALLAWPSGFGDQREARDYATDQKIDRSIGGKADSTAPKKVVGGQTETGPLDWGGVSDLYFAAIFLPDTPDASALVSLHNTMDIPKDPEKPEPGQVAPQPVLGAAVGAPSGTTSVRLFAGPKVLSVLKSVRATAADGKATGPDLLPIVHYGMFSIVAKPLFYALRWLHNHVVPNWGWAILLLTVLITAAMLPTRITMMKSQIKMQRIQPQMNYIKEKYKKYKFDDPRKADMNKEMQELYKKEGVNMFGGCLPMVIQFPLLFAFYEVLENAIELRHAHWFWLHDLSVADPYHILPILMVASQFLFQIYTPSPGVDPAQQKMMAFTMPLFSGFFTWHYASGMALYWTASNIMNIGQQLAINRTKLGAELREIQARRKAKKDGKQLSAARR
jgi:YidC/Oxa1 family membrane protein insertase